MHNISSLLLVSILPVFLITVIKLQIGAVRHADNASHDGQYNKQDTQYTYNLTLRRVSLNIVAVEKQYVLHILSVCL